MGNTESSEIKVSEVYYDNGNLKAQWYRNNDGKLDGHFIEWRIDKTLKSLYIYKDDKIHGLCKTYHGNGTQCLSVNYRNDVLHGPCEKRNQNKRLLVNANYKNGKLDGLYEEWYETENGNYKIICYYRNGKKEGIYIDYYESGKKKVECSYLCDKLVGEYIEYFENEEVRFKGLYNMGILERIDIDNRNTQQPYNVGNISVEIDEELIPVDWATYLPDEDINSHSNNSILNITKPPQVEPYVKTIILNSELKSDTVCPICLIKLYNTDRNEITVTVCGHIFCKTCASRLTQECAICRKSFKL